MSLPAPEQVERRLAQMLAHDSAQTGEGARTDRLMLMLTRSCELRCGYCFESLGEEGHGQDADRAGDEAAGEGGHPNEPPRGDMSLAVLRAALDRLFGSPKPRLSLQIFGGEPTRRWDRVEEAVRAARQHPGRAGRLLEIQLTTNGLGLDPERLAFLAENGVTVQLSVDGVGSANRFRRPELLSGEDAQARFAALPALLAASGVRWFLNVTLPPAASGEVLSRVRDARRMGAPGVQLNYATGMRWRPGQVEAWLSGLAAALRLDHADPGPTQLFNWQNAADPAPLCGDAICDVNGTLLQVGGIFHERRFPTLYEHYRRGTVSDGRPFSEARSSLSELWERTRCALTAEELAVFRQGMEMGAAQDLVCRATARELGRG